MRADEIAAHAEADLDEAFRFILSIDPGRRVLFWVLEQAAIYRDPFGVSSETTNYGVGSQAVGRKLIQRLEQIDARLYPRLLLDMADLRELERAAAHEEGNDDDVD